MTKRVITYVATVTVTVEEDLDSSWHKPFTAEGAKRLARETLPRVGGFITGGAYTAQVKRVSVRKSKEVRS